MYPKSIACYLFLSENFLTVIDHTSLTFWFQGRSPFGPPLEDENGNFILGPNVQHDTDRDYVQEFDSRGHPRNIASQSLQRRMLRAQNEALSTVGVVVRKAKASRSHWQTMNDDQKYRLVVEENMTGAYLGILENVLQKFSTQWILNLRRRMLVSFKNPHQAVSDIYRHIDTTWGRPYRT